MKPNLDKKITSERIIQLELLLSRVQINIQELITHNIEIDLNIINEALTHTSAKASYNHERLEFLGDAVLRLAASEFIDHRFPGMSVGDRSALRSQLVSDEWLSKVGKSIKIEEILIVGKKAKSDSCDKALCKYMKVPQQCSKITKLEQTNKCNDNLINEETKYG